MYRAMYFSPMIPSFNIQKTSAFFRDVLMFVSVMETETYAIWQKDSLTVHVLRAGTDIGQMECYLEVDDVDGVWRDIGEKVTGLTVRPPFNQPYGMREIHIGIPETNALLFIGAVAKE